VSDNSSLRILLPLHHCTRRPVAVKSTAARVDDSSAPCLPPLASSSASQHPTEHEQLTQQQAPLAEPAAEQSRSPLTAKSVPPRPTLRRSPLILVALRRCLPLTKSTARDTEQQHDLHPNLYCWK